MSSSCQGVNVSENADLVLILPQDYPRQSAMNGPREFPAVLKMPLRLWSPPLIAVCCVPLLLLFGREALICFFPVKKVLIHLVCSVLYLDISVLVLIHWQACPPILLEGLPTGILGFMTRSMIFLTPTYASCVLPPMVSTIRHVEPSVFLPQVRSMQSHSSWL